MDPSQVQVSEMEVCDELTGYCRIQEYQKPIQLSLFCQGETLLLTEVRASGTEEVGMCSPRISIVSARVLDVLRGIEETAADLAPLGTPIKRGDLVIRVASLERGPVRGDPDCRFETTSFGCITVGLEITNIGDSPWFFDDDDFHLSSSGSGSLADFENILRGDKRERARFVLSGGERLQANVPRRVPVGSVELFLEFRGDVWLSFSLGNGADWTDEDRDRRGVEEVIAKETLAHDLECGFEIMSARLFSKPTDSGFSSVDEVARCDPDIVRVPSDELEIARNLPDSTYGRLWNPVPLGEAFKDDTHTFNVLAVSRHESSETCGGDEAPEGLGCVAVEIEVTNIRDSGERTDYSRPDFRIIEDDRIASGPTETLTQNRCGTPKRRSMCGLASAWSRELFATWNMTLIDCYFCTTKVAWNARFGCMPMSHRRGLWLGTRPIC